MPRKTVPPRAALRWLRAASMRPRPDAAENERREVELDVALAASMRPRPDAAENGGDAPPGGGGDPRFNEAAARCRGKHSFH